ncbi:MAG: hypothetical protein HYX21_00750 [Candidatus Yanofskybacteria bacterium]|nr:hypothetical protein [Candidatus Yanofskybacteria bacterium]
MNYESRKTLEKAEKEVGPETEPEIEKLDSHTLAFIKSGHIDIPDMADFDPARSLAEIKEFTRHLSKENSSSARAALVREFREKFKIFRENLVKAQLSMEGLLVEDPDESPEKLKQAVGNIIKNYKMGSLAKEFYSALKNFLKARKVIKDLTLTYAEKYGERKQEMLFKKLFGKAPQGKIETFTMPINLLFRVHDPEDYLSAILGRDKNRFSKDAQETLKTSGGLLLNRDMPIKNLKGKIMVENSSVEKNENYWETKAIHEEEHSIHHLIYPTRTMIRKESESIRLHLTKETQTIKFEDFLKSVAETFIIKWEGGAKSEILAYWKTQGHSSETISRILLDLDMYNFLKEGDEDSFANLIVNIVQKTDTVIKSPEGRILSLDEIRQIALRVINEFWELYKKRVARALNEVYELEQKYGDNAEAKLKILRLLSQEPLHRWNRLSRLMTQ